MQWLMAIMAVCALLGGLDRLTGNHFGLGKAFDEGFMLMGPLALSMAGIIVIAPVATKALQAVSDLVQRIPGQDPAMFGAFLAIDMGGWEMATGLAKDAEIGRFAGTVGAATLGCTISFTIPTGMSLYEGESRNHFARGMIWGLVTLPLGLIVGALCGGLPLGKTLLLCLPLIAASLLIALAVYRFPRQTIRAFTWFGWLLRAIGIVGISAGAFAFMTGVELIPGITPLMEALQVVASIGIVLLGSMPLAELLRKLLDKPFHALGERAGIGSGGIMCLLMIFMSITPGLAAIRSLNARGQCVCSAFTVCAASALTAHFAFAVNCAPEWTGPMLLGKFAGAVAACVLAWIMEERSLRKQERIQAAPV